jgi:DNA-directed RNA polymerase specialized sigma subunit
MAFRKIKGHTNKLAREERNKEIYLLWLDRRDEMSLTDIGNRYHLTEQRISQIIKRQGEMALAEEAER